MNDAISSLLSGFVRRRRLKLGHVYARVVQADANTGDANTESRDYGQQQRLPCSSDRSGLRFATFVSASRPDGRATGYRSDGRQYCDRWPE